MLRQQFAAVVTADLWVGVAKNSKKVRQAVNPPSRTTEEGNSTEIFSSVCTKWHQQRVKCSEAIEAYTQSLLRDIDVMNLQKLLA